MSAVKIPDINTVAGPVLIVGLGNPGPNYELTRHNVGYLAIDELCSRTIPPCDLTTNKRTNSMVGHGMLGEKSVVLMKSRTFMNESGGPVAATAKFFNIPAEHIIVFHDDLDITAHSLKVKRGGGEGGHRGLTSISQHLGTRDYLRVRIGVGRPPGRMEAATYVLKRFSAKDREEYGVTIHQAVDAIEILLSKGLAATQNQVHTHH